MKEMKLKRTYKLLILAVMTVILAAPAFAVMADRDSINNVFTVGNMDISIEEPSFDQEEADSLFPGKVVEKDPRVANNDKVDAYVFAQVKIPVKEVFTVADDGVSLSRTKRELFDFDSDESWSLISKESTDGGSFMSYLYIYGTEEEPAVLRGMEKNAPEITEPIFRRVHFVNALEGNGEDNSLTIPINVYGIQSASLEGKRAGEIFTILSNQLETAPDIEVDEESGGENEGEV